MFEGIDGKIRMYVHCGFRITRFTREFNERYDGKRFKYMEIGATLHEVLLSAG